MQVRFHGEGEERPPFASKEKTRPCSLFAVSETGQEGGERLSAAPNEKLKSSTLRRESSRSSDHGHVVSRRGFRGNGARFGPIEIICPWSWLGAPEGQGRGQRSTAF